MKRSTGGGRVATQPPAQHNDATKAAARRCTPDGGARRTQDGSAYEGPADGAAVPAERNGSESARSAELLRTCGSTLSTARLRMLRARLA